MTKTILLTGATDGIGLLTAEKLVRLGNHVIIHGRNPDKLQLAERKLAGLGNGSVSSVTADFSVFADVEQCAVNITKKYSHIDVLINNAGIYKTIEPITKDNLDVRFVVNTLAPYLLTQRLLPLMNHTGRVVNLSSAAQAPVDWQAMAGNYHLQEQFDAYAQSKLAITMWTRYLAQHTSGQTPILVAVNPGSLLASKMVKEGFGVAGKDLNIGADILVQTSLGEAFANATGQYFDNDSGCFAAPHPFALDDENCQRLMAAMDVLLARID